MSDEAIERVKGLGHPVETTSDGPAVTGPVPLRKAVETSHSLRQQGVPVRLKQEVSSSTFRVVRVGSFATAGEAEAALAALTAKGIEGVVVREQLSDRRDRDRRRGVSRLTKNDLINSVAGHGLSKRQSAAVVEAVFDSMIRAFEQGSDVKIVGFGHFKLRKKASRKGRNPQTGNEIEITARRVLTFKPSKGLKAQVNHR